MITESFDPRSREIITPEQAIPPDALALAKEWKLETFIVFFSRKLLLALTESGAIEPLHAANPKLEVGIDRILVHHWHVCTFQCIGNVLNGERIGRRAGTKPQQVNACLQSQFHMMRRSHFGAHQHTQFFLHTLHPRQCLFALSFEASWLGTRFPHTGTKHFDSVAVQLTGGAHHLLLTFRAARAGNDQRTLCRNARQV